MAPAARRRTAILDADAVDRSADGKKRRSRWAVAIAGSALAAVGSMLASASALARLGVPGAESIEGLQLERRAVAAFSRWLQASVRAGGERDDADEPASEPPPTRRQSMPTTASMRGQRRRKPPPRRHLQGQGDQRHWLGNAEPGRLRHGAAGAKVAPSGQVSGMALVFSSTCRRTELAIGGRAVAGTLLLRLGGQFVELSPAD